MRSAFALLLLALLATPAFCQAGINDHDDKPAQPPAPPASGANHVREQNKGIELLKIAEAESAALDGEMRAWMFWQIGIAYQAIDKAKGLELFDTAFIAARTAREDRAATKHQPDP